MKICVADDETQVRESIVLKLKETHPYANVFDVGYGVGALEQIKLIRPELIFADIRMPELDGLGLLEEVMRALPQSKVIILTGYSYFEYAQKAVHLGAADYLLKPADCDELKALVERTYDQLAARLTAGILETLKYMGKGMPLIEGMILANVALWFDDRVLKTIRFGREPWEHGNKEELICSFGWERAHVQILRADPAHPAGMFSRPDELGRIWSQEWETLVTDDFFGRNPAQSIRLIKPNPAAADRWRAAITQALMAANEAKLREGLSMWYAELRRMQRKEVQAECAKLMSMLDAGARHSGQTLLILDAALQEHWLQEVKQRTSWADLQAWLQAWIEQRMAGARTEALPAAAADWFDSILRLLDQRADMDWTLESLAEQAGVHPVTLSRMFKQRTGLSFVRYSTRKRLERAKQLLMDSGQTIGELAERLGYQDHRYFTTLFKNEYGITPGDFRKQNKIMNRHADPR